MDPRNIEFDNEFDIIYNNITSNQAPGLDRYEKSVFLTKAQDEIVKSYFDLKRNKVQSGFDSNERRQIDFSMLIKSGYFDAEDSHGDSFDGRKNTKSFMIEDDVLVFINEYVLVTRKTKDPTNKRIRLIVDPINYHLYNYFMSKPFKYPLKNRAWRLLDNDITSSDKSGKKVEIIIGPNDTLEQYLYRYVKRPKPIILESLSGEEGEYTIMGLSEETPCELDPILYPEIIQRAAELAKAAYIGDLNSQIALGNSSQTPIGAVTQ